MQGLQLLSRVAPAKVDQAFLRQHRVAPQNEYKVVGALQFLGLIDAEGQPTEKSRLLKVRGPAYTLNLQGIVREAYVDLFEHLNPRETDRDRLHNYFVTRAHLGAEMATKAARFFIELCRAAGIPLSPALEARGERAPRPRLAPRRRRLEAKAVGESQQAASPTLSLVFAITPEVAKMEEEELVRLLRRMRNAIRRVSEEGGD